MDELYFRWLKNSVIKIAKVASIPWISSHLKLNFCSKSPINKFKLIPWDFFFRKVTMPRNSFQW